MEGFALQVYLVVESKIVHTAPQDIVFRHDFFDFKAILQSLQAMRRWRAAYAYARHRTVHARLEFVAQLDEQPWNMVVERGKIEMTSRRQLPEKGAPVSQQCLSLVNNQLRQFFQCTNFYRPSGQ